MLKFWSKVDYSSFSFILLPLCPPLPLTLPSSPPPVASVVPRDGTSPGGNQGDHPRGESGSAVQRHPDGRQVRQGSLCAYRGGVPECREVSFGDGGHSSAQTHTHTNTQKCVVTHAQTVKMALRYLGFTKYRNTDECICRHTGIN